MTPSLSELYEMQVELDLRIIEQKGLEGRNLLPNTVLALQVELGECANEWRGFKHWSKDQQPRTENIVHDGYGGIINYTNPLLEEYVDCLHFFLSLARQLEVDPSMLFNTDVRWDEEDISKIFTILINRVGKIGEASERETQASYLYIASMHFVYLGAQLGFTWEQITVAYVAKNQVNHNRQATGY